MQDRGPSTGEVEFGFSNSRRTFKFPLNQAASFESGVERRIFNPKTGHFLIHRCPPKMEVKAVRKVLKFEKINVTINGMAAFTALPGTGPRRFLDIYFRALP